jgi:hypothetical protein
MVSVQVVSQLLVWLGWWALFRRRNNSEPDCVAALQAYILAGAQIVGTGLVLGHLGWLSPPALLGANGGLTLAVWAAAWRPAPVSRSGLMRLARGVFPRAPAGFINGLLLLLNLVVLALTLTRAAWYELGSYDGLCYHLPMVQRMVQEGHLLFTDPPNILVESYPKNIELWFFWNYAFSGSDRWLDAGQVPLLFLAQLAVYCLGRTLGTSRACAATGALLFPFAPVVLAQITTTYTDVGVSALLLAAMALLAVASLRLGWLNSLAFGCSLGLLLGTKFSGLVYAVVLGGAFLAAGLARRLAIWTLVRHVLLLAGVVTAIGGSTYLCNAWNHGNPLYPYEVSLGPVELPGPRSPDSLYGLDQTRGEPRYRTIARSWTTVAQYPMVTHSPVFGGFGVTWLFLLGCCVLWLASAVRRRVGADLLFFLLMVVLFLVTPLNFRVRFTIFLLGLGTVALGRVMDQGRLLVWLGGLGAWVVAGLTVVQSLDLYRGLWTPAIAQECQQPCWNRDLQAFHQAYRWVRARGPRRQRILVFRHQSREICSYCLWNPEGNTLLFHPDPDSEEAFLSLLTAHRDSWWVVPRGSRADHYYLNHAGRFQVLYADDTALVVSGASPSPVATPWVSQLWPHEQAADRQGKSLPNFSRAGYGLGRPVPHQTGPLFDVTELPFGAVPNDGRDDTAALQRAVDAAGANGGGVVFLPVGRYDIHSDPEAPWLTISQSNVVLRGAGADGEGTVLHLGSPGPEGLVRRLGSIPAADEARRYAALAVVGPEGGEVLAHYRADVLRGQRLVQVDDASQFHPGQMVRIELDDPLIDPANPHPDRVDLVRQLTHPFALTAAQGDTYGPAAQRVSWLVQIEAVEGHHRLRLTEPVRFDHRQAYRPRLSSFQGVSGVGIEHLRLESAWPGEYVHHQPFRSADGQVVRSAKEQDYLWGGLWLSQVRDSWIHDVTFNNLTQGIILSHCVHLTVRDVRFRGHAGHAGITMARSHGILVDRAAFFAPRVHPITFSMGASGNVVTNSETQDRGFDQERGTGPFIDFHGLFPHENLLDNLRGFQVASGGDLSVLPHAGVRNVFWNIEAPAELGACGEVGHEFAWTCEVDTTSSKTRTTMFEHYPQAFYVGVTRRGNRPVQLGGRAVDRRTTWMTVEGLNRPGVVPPSLWRAQREQAGHTSSP